MQKKRRPDSCLWGRFQCNGFYSCKGHCPAHLTKYFYWEITNVLSPNIGLLNWCSNDQNKKVQWTVINSPVDKANDRNVALTQGTEKHCHSLLLVPSPWCVCTFVSGNRTYLRQHLTFLMSIKQHRFFRNLARPYSAVWLNFDSGSSYGMNTWVNRTEIGMIRGIIWNIPLIFAYKLLTRTAVMEVSWDKMDYIRYMWLFVWCLWQE